MDSDSIYDSAIQQLEKYKSISSAENIVSKAVESLLNQKEIAHNISELEMSVAQLLSLLRELPPNVTVPQYITRFFFKRFPVKNENFIALEDDLFTLNTGTGLYTYKITYLEEDTVIVKRTSPNGRKMKVVAFGFNVWPTLVPEREEDDIETLKQILREMEISFRPLWKYLQETTTPSGTLSSITANELDQFFDNL